MIDINFTNESRLELINLCLKKTKAKNYLEIGCDKDQIFSKIQVKNKIGVDPFRGGTHRMTSDVFFENNDTIFDVVFIDGLHYYEQVKKDVNNSLKFLNKNGIIVIHDMLPTKEIYTVVPIPNPFTKPWLGDVWRLGFDLIQNSDITFKLVTIDSGCGIILKVPQNPISIHIENSWSFYINNLEKLPLTPFETIKKVLY